MSDVVLFLQQGTKGREAHQPAVEGPDSVEPRRRGFGAFVFTLRCFRFETTSSEEEWRPWAPPFFRKTPLIRGQRYFDRLRYLQSIAVRLAIAGRNFRSQQGVEVGGDLGEGEAGGLETFR